MTLLIVVGYAKKIVAGFLIVYFLNKINSIHSSGKHEDNESLDDEAFFIY